MVNKVEICGVNTSKLPTLTAQEKRSFSKKLSKVTVPPVKPLYGVISGLF